MHIVEFKEQEHFTFYDFQRKLSKTKENVQLEFLLKQLELSHCLKHHIPYQDIVDNNNSFEQTPHHKEYYKFTFVGIITIENYCFLIYPKYWNSIVAQTKKTEKFSRILEVIDKYNNSRRFNIGISNDIINQDKLSTSIHILKEYLLNGLYSNDEMFVKLNGEGQVMWEKTIDESIAYMDKGIPIYLDFFTQTKILNEKDILRRLHAAIVSEIFEDIYKLLSYISLNFNLKLSDEKVSDFGSIDYLSYIINRELSQQFISDKQEILLNMKKYIEGNYNSSKETVQVYGTTSFHVVWEDVCSIVYKNSLNYDMNFLGLKETNSNKTVSSQDRNNQKWKQMKLKHYVEKPAWIKDSKIALANKTLTLDVLSVDTEAKTFHIFDAKYFLINFDEIQSGELKVSGQPGVEDITKQYLYQLAYKELAAVNNYQFFNGFIVPKDDLFEELLPNNLGKGKILGTAQMKILSNIGLEDITIIGRDSHTIFKEYLEKHIGIK